MATHSALTGAELHEPKDVAAATIGTVYTANGAGSGTWSPIRSSTQVIPVTEADLGTDQGSFIQLADNTEYIITGTTAAPFTITKELRYGTNSVITGTVPELSVIKYTGTGVAIRCTSQPLRIRNIKLICNNNTTGTGLVVDNTALATLSLVDNCVFSTMNQLMDLTVGAGVMIVRSFAGIDTTVGVVTSGTNTGNFTIFNVQFLSIASDHIDLGVSIHGDILIENIISTPNSGKALLKALATGANVTNGGKMVDCAVSTSLGGTTLSTITAETLKWIFRDNSVIKNSSWLGNFIKDAGRTNTVLVTSTSVKMAGTTTVNPESERFDDDSGLDNRLKSLDKPPFKAMVTGNVTGQSSGGSAVTVDLELFKNGSFLTTLIGGIVFPTTNDAGFTHHSAVEVVENDFFELFVKRTAGSLDLDLASFDLTIVRVG